MAEHLDQAQARLDRLLVMVLLLFTFLLASFPVRNSDFWRHLASGRLLASGAYVFGVDPFAYTTAQTYWVNPSWLYDVALYGVTMLAGGPLTDGGGIAVVLLKALLITGLAAMLVRVRRPDQGWWWPVVCVGLAMLTLAARILVQPICLSLFFLGLTIVILAREGKKPPEATMRGIGWPGTVSARRLYVLPPLFALWANLDAWFFLGPLTVGLYLLGEAAQHFFAPQRTGPDAPEPGERRTLGWVLVLGLAACLLNPHHVHVFTHWPPELLPRTRFPGLQDDPRFAALFVSPFEKRYFTLPFGLHVTGMAYFPLLLLGAVSFWLTRDDWRTWRLTVWSALALASLPSMMLIPFFAVVAGPITALNLQDYAAARYGNVPATDVTLRRLGLANRLVTFTALLVLLGCTWPGWLHAFPGYPRLERRVGWRIDVDPSLKEAVYKLDYWRTQGLLRAEDRGFNLTPEIAHYCAWFCPQQQAFLDGRLPIFTAVATPYAEARKGLLHGIGLPGGPPASAVADWAAVFREYGINHLVLTGSQWEEIEPLVKRLLDAPREWTLLYLDGRTGIFGWNEPTKNHARFSGWQLDWSARAFGPQAAQRRATIGDQMPRPRSWVDAYLTPRPLVPLSVDESAMLRAYFGSLSQQERQRHEQEWLSITAAGVVGTVEPGHGGLFFAGGLASRAFLSPPLHAAYLATWDLGPPAALLLSLRAARQARAEAPNEPSVYLQLALATDWLWHYQENHWAGSPASSHPTPQQWCQELERHRQPLPHPSPWINRSLSFRHIVRQVQILTALHHGLAVQPDAYRLHGYLADRYWEMSYYDAALHHLTAQVECLREIPPPHRSMEEHRTLVQREPLLAQWNQEVTRLRGLFELHAAALPPRRQAMLAYKGFGLARQALAMFLSQPLETLHPDEVDAVLYLHLTLGEAVTARHGLGPAQKDLLGAYRYELLRTLEAAGTGRYAEADQALALALAARPEPPQPPLLSMLQALTFGRLQPHLLTQHTLLPYLHFQLMEAQLALTGQMQGKDLYVLRGLLALEDDDVPSAERFFRQALQPSGLALEFESRRIAERYLEIMQDQRR